MLPRQRIREAFRVHGLEHRLQLGFFRAPDVDAEIVPPDLDKRMIGRGRNDVDPLQGREGRPDERPGKVPELFPLTYPVVARTSPALVLPDLPIKRSLINIEMLRRCTDESDSSFRIDTRLLDVERRLAIGCQQAAVPGAALWGFKSVSPQQAP